MSTLKFRNVEVTPDDPVEEWGTEGILAAIDRGGLEDWQKIRHALKAHPHGAVAACVEEALGLAESEVSGVVARIRFGAHRKKDPRSDTNRHWTGGSRVLRESGH